MIEKLFLKLARVFHKHEWELAIGEDFAGNHITWEYCRCGIETNHKLNG